MTSASRLAPATACIRVPIPPGASVADLLGERPVDEAFTPAERRRCAERPGLGGWAGRPELSGETVKPNLGRAAGLIAAKRAVLRVLDAPPDVRLADVEVLPDAGRCPAPGQCTASHPPAVRLRGALPERLAPGESVIVSISHARTVAVALAVRC